MDGVMIQINNKTKLLIFLLCVLVLASTINTTYSRYVSAANGTVTTDFARWQLFVNNENITSNYTSSMTFTPVILPNNNVAANKIAPSSKGYFDVAINPTNVDVAFTYDINLNVPEDSLITDVRLTDYVVVEGTEITDDSSLTKIPVTTSNITDTLFYSNTTQDFSFKPFVIRMYFAWFDGEGETMDDEDDANIGNMIANGDDTKFELGVNITFKQYTGEAENVDPDTNEEIIENGNEEPNGNNPEE